MIAAACSLQAAAQAQNTTALNALIRRRAPFLNNKVVFTSIPNVHKDTAAYYTKAQKLYIQSSGTTAAAFALNDYLRTYCGISFSHTGDQVTSPASLPEVKKTVSVAASFRYRYALNYCTYNYTMSFWGWKEWEHELDWMALNGVNLMLAPVGTEIVWQQVLKEMGFSEADIRAYIPGPAFNAWWLMGNIQGWGGPASDAMIQHWSSLQQHLLQRMRELDIQPVLQGFCGLVPSTIKKYFPTARIVEQGSWGEGFIRPVFLLPQDSMFKEIAQKYYAHMRRLYGNASFLGGDLFHEGGATGNINLAETATLIQTNMQQYYPGSTWILQAWQDNPKKDFLKGLDVSHTLVLDLRGDGDNNWERTNGFSGYPWIWCSMVNGGGTLGMEGRLLRILKEPARANITAAGRSMMGTGIVPEGIANNDIMYTSLLLAGWQKEINDVDVFLKRYVVARYGKYDSDIYNAWQLLLQSAYISHTNDIAGAFESIFCARPDTNFIISASTWGSKKLPYDTAIFYNAAACFAKAAARFSSSETYRYDLTDIWRQVIALKARQPYAAFMKAWQEHNWAAFKSNAVQFIALLKMQNRWTATNNGFNIRTWLQQAESIFPDEKDKALSVWNAKVQITYWGHSGNPATQVHDYANKEWSGLLQDYYLPRWMAFFDYMEKHMQGIPAPWPDFFGMEKAWTEQRDPYSDNKGEDGIVVLPEVMKVLGIK